VPAEAPWLIFVDTNVFLDFYRIPGERARRQLDGLLRHRQSIIVTEQVHMEYLKNRQKVIADGLRNIKRSSLTNVPSLIGESKYGQSAIKADKALDTRVKKLEAYTNKLLLNPGAYDSVYKSGFFIAQPEAALSITY
jgi:predicted nucleic acid-binding protein